MRFAMIFFACGDLLFLNETFFVGAIFFYFFGQWPYWSNLKHFQAKSQKGNKVKKDHVFSKYIDKNVDKELAVKGHESLFTSLETLHFWIDVVDQWAP